MQHPGAAEWLRQLTDTFERSGLDDAFVVIEVLVEQRHAFEQRNS
jgi:hypothetical protein